MNLISVTSLREDIDRNVELSKNRSVFVGRDNLVIGEEDSLGRNLKLVELFKQVFGFERIFENTKSGLMDGLRKVFEIKFRKIIMLKLTERGKKTKVDNNNKARDKRNF